MCLPRWRMICTSGGHRCSPLMVTMASSVSSRRHSSKARSSSRWKYRAMTLRISSSSVKGLHQLDAVAERIVCVHAVVAVQRLILHHVTPSLCEGTHEATHVLHHQGHMCLGAGPELLLDAEMDLDAGTLEPAPAPGGKQRRLGDVRYPQRALVEGDCVRLSAP